MSTKGETASAAESGGLEESLGRVLITWPEGERASGVLRVDGTELGYEEFVDAGNRDLLRLVLIPGEHVVRLERQGFEAWKERVKVEAGQEVALHPQWRAINVPQAGQAEQMLAEGQKPTETAAPVEKPPAEPPVAVTSVRLGLELAWEKLEGLLREWEAREAEFTQKVAPIEELVNRWRFQEAAEAAKGFSFTDPSLAERWRVRQEGLAWLAEWKGRILEKINAGGGRLRKADLGLRGLGGEVIAADEEKLTCRLLGGKTEELPWEDLGSQAPGKLIGLVVEPSKPEDLLKAGVFLASLGQAGDGMRYLVQAQQTGVEVQAHLELASYPLISELVTCLRKKEYPADQGVLKRLEEESGLTEWRTKHQAFLEAMRGVLTAAQREAEAEKLYAEAVKLYKEQELHDVKPLVDGLKGEYADTTPVLETTRQPPLAELEKSTANLGRRIVVRQDGKGDFTTIQAAIDAASSDGLIAIADSGPYMGPLILPAGKPGLSITGKRGSWPVITWPDQRHPVTSPLLQVNARGATLRRLMILHNLQVRSDMPAVAGLAGPLSMLETLVFSSASNPAVHLSPAVHCEMRESVFLGNVISNSRLLAANCLFLGAQVVGGKDSHLQFCTLAPQDSLSGNDYRWLSLLEGGTVTDCVVERFKVSANTLVEHCVYFGRDPFTDSNGMPGNACFQRAPLFRDPASLDFRPMPSSPCMKKASDGGDIGVRYTPEMIEMINVALELRRRGTINF